MPEYATRTALWTVVVATLRDAGYVKMLPQHELGGMDLDASIKAVDDVYEWMASKHGERPHGLLGQLMEESLQQGIEEGLMPPSGKTWGRAWGPRRNGDSTGSVDSVGGDAGQ